MEAIEYIESIESIEEIESIKDKKAKELQIFYMMKIYFAYLKLLGMEYRQMLIELNKTNSNFQIVSRIFFEKLYTDEKLTYIIDCKLVVYPLSVTYEEMDTLNTKIFSLYNSILVGNIN